MSTTVLAHDAIDFTWDRKPGVDRCDRCGSEAFVKASIKGTGGLLFCAHHGRQHAPALVERGYCVLDYSHLLNESPSPSANAD